MLYKIRLYIELQATLDDPVADEPVRWLTVTVSPSPILTNYRKLILKATGYSQHILNTGHEKSYDITYLDIVDVRSERLYLHTVARCYVHKNIKEWLAFNELQYDNF
jgi:hypothetical protein